MESVWNQGQTHSLSLCLSLLSHCLSLILWEVMFSIKLTINLHASIVILSAHTKWLLKRICIWRKRFHLHIRFIKLKFSKTITWIAHSLSDCLSVCLSLSLSRSLCLSVWVCLSVYLPVYLSVCQSVCLSLLLWPSLTFAWLRNITLSIAVVTSNVFFFILPFVVGDRQRSVCIHPF